jgi:ATP-dependent helicase/nuclease subunit A
LKLYGQGELQQLSEYVIKLKGGKTSRPAPTVRKLHPKQTEGKLLSQVKKSLAWRYRFGDAPLLPAKRSVTQLTHSGDEYVRIDYSRALERKPKAVLSGDLAEVIDERLALRKESIVCKDSQGGLPQVIGAATHSVIASLDLAGPITRGTIEKTKEKLLADGSITEPVAGRINVDSIMRFFESELGQAALEADNTVWREWPFTFALPASEWKDSYLLRDTRYEIRDTIVVQGIIDMLVKRPAGLLVIDFKTDNISAGEVDERAEVYKQQLELYSRAVEAILGDKSVRKWLYFLTPGCAIEVK